MSGTLSTLNTTTKVPLSKAPDPQLLPRAPQNKWLPINAVWDPEQCSRCVCVFTAVCVHLDGLNAEH